MKLLDYNSFINQDRQKPQSVNEHLWSGIIHRSESGRDRKENMIPCDTKEDIQEKIQEIIDETQPNEGDTIDLNHLDVSGVEDMSNLFFDYVLSKYNYNVSKWDVSNVTNMESMFWGCENFNSDLSKWNVSNVKDMSFMFYGCKNFNSDLSNWDVSSVTDMCSMFNCCMSFNSDLSRWKVSNVENMNFMFSRCGDFNSNLSHWDVSNVTNMGHMFNGCSSLQKLPKWYHE